MRPVEIQSFFPGVGRVIWEGAPSGRPETWLLKSVFYLSWLPDTDWRQPGLIVSAVPTEHSPAVRSWLENTVAPDARAWLKALKVALAQGRAVDGRFWRVPRSVLGATA
jgi:hypothetical protein